MEPNNFDKKIQQKFNSRKIEPSAQAWDRLDAMLTIAEEKKQPKKYAWLKIAATFLIFSGIGYIFFQQNQKSEIVSPTHEVVISKEKSNSNSNDNINTNEVQEQHQITTQNENVLAVASSKTSNLTTKNNSNYKKTIYTTNITEKRNVNIAQNENNIKQQQEINQKPTYNYITPESLLADVQGTKKTNGNTNTYQSTLKVNPNDLLNSVESELDQSFKDKTLAKLKQVKSAVVNRNYN